MNRLAAIGAALALWCIFVLLQARYTQSLPPEKLVVTQTLPPDVQANPGVAAPPPPPSRGTVLARLEVPSVNLATTVLEGSDDRTLRKASGHIEETPLPGQPGNIGIAGHRDTMTLGLLTAFRVAVRDHRS